MKQQVAEVIAKYPLEIQTKVKKLRQLILDVADGLNKDIEETLKWNEPSYLTKGGSTIRIAWRKASPTQYGLFFNCKTTLIETFREVYADIFSFNGNREIVFELGQELPIKELKHCIQLSLSYNSIKHLPLLGIY